MTIDRKPPPAEQVQQGCLNEEYYSLPQSQEQHYEEENAKLNDEPRQKDVELTTLGQGMSVMKMEKMSKKNDPFFRFSALPTELRHLIYSKLTLNDRVAASRACSDMAVYCMSRRIKEYVYMSLTEENNKVYVKIEFSRSAYVEMHRIPDRLVPTILHDLFSSIDCECKFCVNQTGAVGQVRYCTYCACTPYTVFETFSLINVSTLKIKTGPIGGLVDFLQPRGRCKTIANDPSELIIVWHQLEEECYERNDSTFQIDNWRKWFDFASAPSVMIEGNRGDRVSDRRESPDVSHNDEDVTRTHIHKDLFDLEVVRNADRVYSDCRVDISLTQLMDMKASELFLCDAESSLLINLELFEFYKAKIQQWLNAPETVHFHYAITTDEQLFVDPNPEKLLEYFRQQLETPEFRVYPSFDLDSVMSEDESEDDGSEFKYYTIRSMQTGSCLTVSDYGIQARVPEEDGREHLWPENHGF